MQHPTFRIAIALAAGFLAASLAHAAPVESPDEICSPVADPCVLSTTVEMDADFPLDFGLRTVRVTGSGQIRGTADIECGAFESDVTGTWMTVLPAEESGEVTITAQRSCSLNATIACLSDTVCATAGAGTCSGGDGGIRLAGLLTGNSSDVTLRAAGDIELQGKISAVGKPPIANGGSIFIESSFGSIESAAILDVTSGIDPDYGGPGLGGYVTLRAEQDLTLRAQIVATGGAAEIEADAGRDIVVIAGILTQGRPGAATIGGTIDLSAGQDLRIYREPGLVAPQLNIVGGTKVYNGYYGYGYTAGGHGGYGFFNAGRDLQIDRKVRLLGDSGAATGIPDVTPMSGDWYFEASEDLSFEASLLSRAWGRYGFYNHGVSFYGDESVRLGRRSQIATNGSYSGPVAVYSANDGPVSLEGRINVAGRKIRYYGYTHGTGGEVRVRGGDVSMRGRIQNGGPTAAGRTSVQACRLHLQPGGRFDGALGAQDSWLEGASFLIRESMRTDPGSAIRGKEGAIHEIEYRDAAKPPVLNGLVTPAPFLTVNPDLAGCPVCGNLEIDQGEGCDDGNSVGGDGCDTLCQVEP